LDKLFKKPLGIKLPIKFFVFQKSEILIYRRYILILLLLFFCNLSNAQSSLYPFLMKPDSLNFKKKFIPILTFNRRTSNNDKKKVLVHGFNMNLLFNKRRHETTLAYYWWNENQNNLFFSINRKTLKPFYTNILKNPTVDFFSVGHIYYPIVQYRYRLGIPVEIGYGKIRESQTPIYPLQIGCRVDFRLTRYFEISGKLGYRHIQSDLVNLSPAYFRLTLNTDGMLLAEDIYKLLKNVK
jgi:hypothetical protein